MTFIEQLRNRWQSADSLLCVGLDPDPAKFPDAFVDDEDALFLFCRDIVDATAEYACAFKPQIAYFAAHNGGEAALQRLIAHIDGTCPDIPVILDSPLAIAATAIFRRNTQYYDKEARDILTFEKQSPLEMPQLQFSVSAAESKALNMMEGPAIIISASGMADAGRILHHLKHNLWRPECSVLFVGFQAEGSMGRRLVEGGTKVRIMGEEIGVRAHIYNLNGMSAHADREDIITWLECFNQKPAQVFLVHGEPASAEQLSKLIGQKLAVPAYIPRYGDVVTFMGQDWQVSQLPGLPSLEPAVRELQEILGELDSAWTELKVKLEILIAADGTKLAAITSRIGKIKKFVRKTLGDL